MIIKQLSVFIEDRSGRLTELTRILAENDINITALSLAETTDYGIVRMVVGRPDLAKDVLEGAGFSVGLTDVVCLRMPDKPGGLYAALRILTDNDINIDYMYAFSNNGVALAVIRAKDIDRVIDVLQQNKMQLSQPERDLSDLILIPIAVDKLKAYFKQDRFAALCGLELVECRPGYSKVQLKINDSHFNAAGVVHGAVLFCNGRLLFRIGSKCLWRVALSINSSITLWLRERRAF